MTFDPPWNEVYCGQNFIVSCGCLSYYSDCSADSQLHLQPAATINLRQHHPSQGAVLPP